MNRSRSTYMDVGSAELSRERSRPSRKMRGASMVEFLIVTPVLLLLGLGVVQAGLWFYAKNALNFALQEAARSGAVNHASIDSVRNGLLRGLVPFKGGGRSAEELAATLARATEEFALGSAQGWIRMRQLSPMPASFTDWEEESTDEAGERIREIPNANLAVLRCTREPNNGISAVRLSNACGASGERIGTNSQQTLADANLLRLHLTYGVKLVVPFVNRIVGRALAMANGCIAPEQQKIGPLNLGTPGVAEADDDDDEEAADDEGSEEEDSKESSEAEREAKRIACAAYNARDAEGNPEPRIPVSLSLTVRMQSTPRTHDDGGWFIVADRDRDANTGVQLGNGQVDAASNFTPIPVAQLNPNGVTSANDNLDGTGNGSVRLGADTEHPPLLGGGGGSCGTACCAPPRSSPLGT